MTEDWLGRKPLRPRVPRIEEPEAVPGVYGPHSQVTIESGLTESYKEALFHPSSPAPVPIETLSTETIFAELLRRFDPTGPRSGTTETPSRAAKAWAYWCGGYELNVDELFKAFEDGAEGYDEMVIVHGIPVYSHCEHHLASIVGHAHVGYIPDGRVAGLSKLARVVDALSRRLQVQERLTVQIADAVDRNLKPKGVGVLVKAAHHCMSTRGVRIHGSVTTTSALRGVLHSEASARAEFMSLCAAADKPS
jgi:GTP cyclohydrolase I